MAVGGTIHQVSEAIGELRGDLAGIRQSLADWKSYASDQFKTQGDQLKMLLANQDLARIERDAISAHVQMVEAKQETVEIRQERQDESLEALKAMVTVQIRTGEETSRKIDRASELVMIASETDAAHAERLKLLEEWRLKADTIKGENKNTRTGIWAAAALLVAAFSCLAAWMGVWHHDPADKNLPVVEGHR